MGGKSEIFRGARKRFCRGVANGDILGRSDVKVDRFIRFGHSKVIVIEINAPHC